MIKLKSIETEYKKSKVSVLQANVNLVQKGECWTWNRGYERPRFYSH